MEELPVILIVLGAILMVFNILWYLNFLHSTHDVLSAGGKIDIINRFSGLILLVFFLVGYIFIAFQSPELMMALVLFFGSIFVSIVLIIMFKLINTTKKRSLDITETLINIIDARDPNLNGHSVHVQRLSMLLYNHLPHHIKSQINPISLSYASLIHDIGKLGVPESILNKPAKLTDEEWEIMKKHPEIGIKLLKPINTFDEINDWIYCHHERIDGNGYYKIKADKIPLAAKIISIADAYSAITMRRSYKDPRTHEEAIAILKDGANKQFDEELVDIFVSIPKEQLEECIPETIKY